MVSYAYSAPASVDESLSILNAHAKRGERTQILAGGTDVLVQMRTTDKAPRVLVDIKNIRETQDVRISSDEIYIGSAVPSGILNENEELKVLLPGLLEAAGLIGSTQIQGRASIGGNLCNSSPAGDTIPALMANSARCVIASASGRREVAVANFVTGVGQNCLATGEFLLGLNLPRPWPSTSDAYLRFIPRSEMDIAVASAGVSVTLDENGTCTAARVSIGAVAPTPLLVVEAGEALIGTKVDDDALALAAHACSKAASPITDRRGTAEYRTKVVGVLCKRAGAIAKDRAGRSPLIWKG